MIGLPKAILVRHYAPFSLLLILGASCTNRDLPFETTPAKPAFAVQDATNVSGTVSAWGGNFVGDLGNGTNTNSNTPVEVSGLSGVTAIAGGEEHSLALKGDGTVWAWGDNGTGELGANTFGSSFSNTPLQVLGPGGVGDLAGVTAIAGGDLWSLALKSDGTVWAWGWNVYGQLGNGTNTTSNTPVQVSGLSGVTAIAAGNHGLALKSDGTVWAWGDNSFGELGNGTNTTSNTPVQVLGLSGVTAIAAGVRHSLALKSDGTIWAWGANSSGQLGNGTNTNSNTPLQVSGLSGVTAIAGANANNTYALKSDGTVWAWGDNFFGELGNGTFTPSNTPAQVVGTGAVGYLSGVTVIASGSFLGLALKSDGTVWAWGLNESGQLGNGTNTNSNTPVQVLGTGGVGYLSGVTAIAGGGFFSLALEGATSAPPLAIVPPPAVTVATDVGRCDAQVNLGTATTAGGTPPITLAATPAGPYSVGKTTVTWTATDATGSTASATQTVAVFDPARFSITAPAAITLEAGPGGTVSVDPSRLSATLTANCPGGITLTSVRSDGLPLDAPYPLGTTGITFTATDASGYSLSVSTTVTVVDTTPPVITVSGTFVVNATSPSGAVVFYVASARDVAAGVVPVTCSPPSGSTFPIGTTALTCSAADPSGNQVLATFHVTVLSAQAQISNLETSVTNLALSTGTTTSLSAKLNDALAAANAGDVATACASLQDFINETRAQAGKKISISDANTLSATAQSIRAALGC